MGKVVKSILCGALVMVSIISCGKKKEEIDPNAVRVVKANLIYSTYIESGLRIINNNFRATENCIQHINYMLNGSKVAERIEVSAKACPVAGQAIPTGDVLAKFKVTELDASTWAFYNTDASKPFGEITLDTGISTNIYNLQQLCGQGEPSRVNLYKNCGISLGSDAHISGIN